MGTHAHAAVSASAACCIRSADSRAAGRDRQCRRRWRELSRDSRCRRLGAIDRDECAGPVGPAGKSVIWESVEDVGGGYVLSARVLARAGRCGEVSDSNVEGPMKFTSVTCLTAVLALAPSLSGQIPPYGGADALRADLAQRRAKAMAALGPESVLIAWSASPKVYSTDVDYT